MNRINTQTFIINEEDNDYDHDCNNYNDNNKNNVLRLTD